MGSSRDVVAKPCKINLNSDFLLTLCRRRSSWESFRRSSETVTEDLSHSELKSYCFGSCSCLTFKDDVHLWIQASNVHWNFANSLWAAVPCPNYAQQDQKDKTRIQLLLIRRQKHCELPELYLSKQQKGSQSARKNSNCIFLFSSFHQLQKTGKNKIYFSVKSRQTKLKAFTAVRKTIRSHTSPTFTYFLVQ